MRDRATTTPASVVLMRVSSISGDHSVPPSDTPEPGCTRLQEQAVSPQYTLAGVMVRFGSSRKTSSAR
jgi:hypothetical protein